MSNPKAYDPQDGYKYQIMCRNPRQDREWEHCGYAKGKREKNYLFHFSPRRCAAYTPTKIFSF